MNNGKKEFDKPIRLPQGVSDFKELVYGKYIFVDKTLFVKEIMEDGAKVIVITRPRRFGKTLNLSMLYYFLQMSGDLQDRGMFGGLEVAGDLMFCANHQSSYPVIFVSFKGIKTSNYQDSYKDIEELIRRLYEEHKYLLEGTLLSPSERATFMAILNKSAELSDIKVAIKYLLVYMTKKFNKKPILLLDEYDTPIQEAYLHGYYKEMIELMRSILGEALKDNKVLEKAVITGITRISQESLFSGVNNLTVYSVLRKKYGQYFGFTEKEVSKLIAETGQAAELNAIKEWYNGYQIDDYVLYNPWSIINCLANDGELQPYWLNTGSTELIARLLSKANIDVKYQFEELLQGKVITQPISENLVFPEVETNEDALWSLLLYAGYLKVLSSELGNYQLMAKLAIPNKEVGFVYSKIIAGWFRVNFGIGSYNEFVQALRMGDLEKFKTYLSNYILQTGSYFDFNSNTPEQIFHVFILGLVVGLLDHYYIYSNKESGFGRCDVIFIPHDKQAQGIVLEFKTSEKPELLKDKAEEALSQIKDKRYVEIFKQNGINSVSAIGLAFAGKQMELVHQIIQINQ
jgi:hypothetical protein